MPDMMPGLRSVFLKDERCRGNAAMLKTPRSVSIRKDYVPGSFPKLQ
jgi:hypothetical protein